MTWEKRLELSNTISICGLNATKPSGIKVGGVGRVAVATGRDARIYTRRVAVPHLKIHPRDGVAGIDIDYLVVKNDVDTLLILNDIAANVFSADIVRSLSDLRGQHTRVVAREHCRSINVQRIAELSSVVRSSQNAGSIALSKSPYDLSVA
jgi:hypothetical protein